MLKTILSAACASALFAGAAFAQSATTPQDSTLKDPARMEKPAWTNQGPNTQPYPSKSGTPSAFDKAEKKAMDAASGGKATDRDRRMSRTRSSSGTAAGASSAAIFPECSDAGPPPEEVTRCLNRNMAQALQRGVGANELIDR